MKVILVKDNTSKNSAVCFGGRKLLVGGIAAFVALPIALGLATYWVVSSIDRSLNPFVDPEYRMVVETRVAEQEQEMQKTRKYVRQHLDVLGSRVGALQAQVSRINAVEMRIAEASGINLDDFESILIHCESYNILWGGFDIPNTETAAPQTSFGS